MGAFSGIKVTVGLYWIQLTSLTASTVVPPFILKPLPLWRQPEGQFDSISRIGWSLIHNYSLINYYYAFRRKSHLTVTPPTVSMQPTVSIHVRPNFFSIGKSRIWLKNNTSSTLIGLFPGRIDFWKIHPNKRNSHKNNRLWMSGYEWVFQKSCISILGYFCGLFPSKFFDSCSKNMVRLLNLYFSPIEQTRTRNHAYYVQSNVPSHDTDYKLNWVQIFYIMLLNLT